MPGRITEVAALAAAAVIVTAVIAAPVLRAPSERVFGIDIVGRHHDPFTAMAQFERPISIGIYAQPVTDIPGALLARVSGAVAAYNWLVLLSFPLSAAAAYLLARHLKLSPAGASVAAMAYAFAPFHLAHAAYHPHIAQTQWLPLYLLALWRCLDDASPGAVAFLCAATIAVTLSNFYGGFIATVIAPFAVVAYWFVSRRTSAPSMRQLAITAGTLVALAASGAAYAWYAAGAVVANRAAFAFARSDLFEYSAKWWSYVVPPIEHPWLGDTARTIWNAAGVRDGLLEQQVSLGLGIIALGLVAIFHRRSARGDGPQAASLVYVPALTIVAVVALICSLSPERSIAGFTFVRPSALLYDVVPMFRAYARFGVVVQLMAAMLAGIGVDRLRRAGTARAQIVCAALVVLAVGEYAVSPSAMSRDVLPTAAHRFVARQSGRVRALDCAALDRESASVPWLTGHRVMLLGGATSDCLEPDLPPKLAAVGFTHLLVRRRTVDGQWFAEHAAPDGLQVAARFDDGQVFRVSAHTPAIYMTTMAGFSPREQNAEWTWRWMGRGATWTIVNTTAQPIVTTLEIELAAFREARRLEMLLDGRHVQTLVVGTSRRICPIGPLRVPPGDHELAFRPCDEPEIADSVVHNGDGRPLSFAIGTWRWVEPGAQP